MKPRIQKAFTLVELLVVITIIGMLVALLLPAVNAARAAGQKTKCTNNLRELGHAVLEYTTAHDYFPGYRQPLTVTNATGGGSSKIVVNWQVVLLPNLGRNDLYQALQAGTLTQFPSQFPYLEISVCPSDNSAVGTTGNLTAWTSYVANTGRLDLPVLSTSTVCVADSPSSPETSADGIFMDRVLAPNAKVTLTDIKDGQSTTLMLAENIDAAFYSDGPGSDTPLITLNPTNFNFAAWKAQLDAARNCSERGCGFVWWDTSTSSGSNPPPPPNDPPTGLAAQVFKINGKAGDYDPVRVPWLASPYDISPPAPNANTNYAARPAGPHSGGVVVVFAAGNTKFQRDDIDYSVYCLLMTPDGAKAPTKSQFGGKSWQQWKILNEGSL